MKTPQSKSAVIPKPKKGDEYIRIAIEKSQARFTRIKNPKGADTGVGEYLLLLKITAKTNTVYVPLSLASGKKVTGFIYQIEGTASGALSKATVFASGEGVALITLGTIQYVQIPLSKTALFRIQIEIKGKIGKTYKVVLNHINYKLQPTDARYKKFVEGVASRPLEFK